MEKKIKKVLKESKYRDPNENNSVPKIPDSVWAWCFARIREPSTAIGLAAIASGIGIKIEPTKASAVMMIALGIGGFLAFVMREKKNLIHEGGNPKIDINWGMLKGWFLARLAEPTSKIGILMILVSFGLSVSEAHFNAIVSIIMMLGGGVAVVHEEGDREDKTI